MANITSRQILQDGPSNVTVKLTGILDTSNIAVTDAEGLILDPAELSFLGEREGAPTRIIIDEINASVETGLSVDLYWEAVPNVLVASVNSSKGTLTGKHFGGWYLDEKSGAVRRLVFSTAGWSAGAVLSYTIILKCRKSISYWQTMDEILEQLESANVNGAFYDPSNRLSLNQLSTGTTPVTAVTDPVGLVLDSRLGLVLGPQLVTNGNSGTFTTDITGVSAITVAIARDTTVFTGGGLKVTAGTPNNSGTYATVQTITTVVGKSYILSADVYAPSTNVASNCATLTPAGTGAGDGIQASAEDVIQSKSCIFVATATTANILAYVLDRGVVYGTAGDVAYFDNISVKLLDGNHAIQATAAARPTWQVDAGGNYYLSFLGTDDSLTSATGGGGDAGFFWCGVIEPTGGAGTLRTLWADNGTNTGYKVQLDASNKLSFSAGNNTAFTTKVSTATLTTKSRATVWDDGTNLNVQINDVATETVARPVVVAGTAGYTVGKDNGAASSFSISNHYPSLYTKDTGLTATQRANVQAVIRSLGGL